MAAKSRLIVFSLLLLSACSWEYQRSHFKTPFYNPQPGEFTVRFDTILHPEHGPCSRSQYFINKGNWLHMSACKCEDLWRVDSAFDKKGRLYLSQNHHLSNSSSFLYDSSATIYFDRKERPIKRYISIDRVDTSYEYWHYYDAQGKPEAEKRPVIYSLL